jgi:hypothetical protein
VRRAVLAALAHPPILADRGAARFALGVTRGMLDDFAAIPAPERRSEGVRVLRKALEYAPSVVVAAIPEEGFAWLREVARLADRDAPAILRANLQKKRLADRFQTLVSEVLACASG